MAEKSKSGGGGGTWLVVGFLLGVVATLGALAFLAHDPETPAPIQAQSAIVAPPISQPVSPGAAQPASPTIAGGPQAEAQTQTAPTATAPTGPAPAIAPDADNLDPDDAASVGMTSRAQPR